jgi:effector-binding domain-containing protein
MVGEPEVVQRAEQPYVATAGAPFWKYNVIDMERQLEVEVGFPVAVPVAGDDRVLAGVLSAGKYATVLHIGHPDSLVDATRAPLDWAASQGLTWDVTETEEGDRWGARLEIYGTDPAEEPSMNNWETELAFRLAD